MKEHILIRTEAELNRYLQNIVSTKPIVLDTESVSLDYESPLLGVSMYQPESNQPPCFIQTYNASLEGSCVDEDLVVNKLPILTDVGYIFHNAKHDKAVFMKRHSLYLPLHFDTLIAIHQYNPSILKKLETRVKEDLGYQKKTLEDLIGKKWGKIDWSDNANMLILAKYSCEDVYYTYALYELYKSRLEKMGDKVCKVLYELEQPLVDILVDMKLRGVKIDLNRLKELENKILPRIATIEAEIYEEAGVVFNINSNKQLAEVLYDQMKLPVLRQTKAGGRSTDKDTMNDLAEMGHKIAVKLKEHSSLTTLYSSFIKAIPELVDKEGILHGDFNSTGTETGRFSSANPNLQNQPAHGEAKNYPVRDAFVPRQGYTFLVFDWSQIELRMTAHLSGDPIMINAFLSGKDFHQATADDLGISRSEAKAVNFGIHYGLGAEKLAYTLKTSKQKAKAIIDKYYSTYTTYTKWKKAVQSFAERNGYIETLFGRRRVLPLLHSKDAWLYSKALRQSVNTFVQGSSADLMKICMVKLYSAIRANNYDAHILLTVHDELVIEVNTNIIDVMFNLVKEIMETTITLDVPVVADGKICDSWNEMKAEVKKPSVEVIGYETLLITGII